MSDCLYFILVDADKLRNACGSKDQSLKNEILERHAETIEDFTRWTELEGDAGVTGAIDELIDGRPVPIDYNGRGLAGYEILGKHMGEWLGTEHFCDMHGGYLEEVVATLAKLGLADYFSYEQLYQRGPLPGIPIFFFDEVVCSYFTPEELQKITAALPNGDTSAAFDLDDVDPEFAGATEEMLEIMLKAGREGKTLILTGG